MSHVQMSSFCGKCGKGFCADSCPYCNSPMLNPKELATVLAALRHWQDLEERDPQADKFKAGSDRTGTHFEEHDPLTVEEIDALCERLNTE